MEGQSLDVIHLRDQLDQLVDNCREYVERFIRTKDERSAAS